jgi:hypothetical protein
MCDSVGVSIDARNQTCCCSVVLQVGVAVYQVLPREEEAISARASADEPSSTTRLVIPEDVISSSMIRCG